MIDYAIPGLILAALLLLSWPLGMYMRWAMDPLHPGPRRLWYERWCRRLFGKASVQEQDWKQYCRSLLCFNLLIFVVAYVVLTAQGWLPLNPDGKEAMEPSLAFNTAASFTTNTNLQH